MIFNGENQVEKLSCTNNNNIGKKNLIGQKNNMNGLLIKTT